MPTETPKTTVRNGFNPMGGNRMTFIALLMAQDASAFQYDVAADCKIPDTDDNGEEIPGSSIYDSDGSHAVTFQVSVATPGGATKRGSAVMSIPGDQMSEAVEELQAYDPEAEEKPSEMSVAQCIRATISRDMDTTSETFGVTSFKVSLEKNARTINVPRGEWSAFLDYMNERSDKIPQAAAYYRLAIAEAEAAARADAEKKAALAAKAASVTVGAK